MAMRRRTVLAILLLAPPAALAVACGSKGSSQGDRAETSSPDGSAVATSDDSSTPAASDDGSIATTSTLEAGDAPGDGATDGGEASAPSDGSAAPIVIPTGLVIPTDHGSVQGKSTSGVRAFLGIPFGATTAGDNRWKPPQPADPWSATRDATAYGPSCVADSSEQ